MAGRQHGEEAAGHRAPLVLALQPGAGLQRGSRPTERCCTLGVCCSTAPDPGSVLPRELGTRAGRTRYSQWHHLHMCHQGYFSSQS